MLDLNLITFERIYHKVNKINFKKYFKLKGNLPYVLGPQKTQKIENSEHFLKDKKKRKFMLEL